MKEKKPVEDNRGLEKPSPANVKNKAESDEALPGWPLVGLSITSFIQVVAMDQQTCLLEVYHESNQQGHFCFIQGSLYDAVCGDLTGEEAALEIMAWQNVRLNIKHLLHTSDVVRRIEKGLMSLLMESSRRQDEAKRLVAPETTDEERESHGEPAREGSPKDALHELRTRLARSQESLQKNMGKALIGSCVVDRKSGESLLGYQSTPAVADLFKSLTERMEKVCSRDVSGEELGRYYYLDLAEDQTLFVLLFDDYLWGVVFHNGTVALGLFLNVIMPQLIKCFE